MTLLITILACLLLVASAIAFLRTKDVFVMIHVIKIVNFYIIPLILIAFEINKFSIISFAKIAIIIILNFIITIILSRFIVRRAIEDKIIPDADFKDLMNKTKK